MDNLNNELSEINKAERAGEVLVGFKEIGMLRIEKELIKVCELIENLGVTYFLMGGVLLGLARSGRLLEHDKDIDLGVMGDKALDILYEGLMPYYEIVHFDSRGKNIKKGNFLWAKKYFKIDGKYHCLPIEIQAYYKKRNCVFYNKDLGNYEPFKEGRVVWDKQFFKDFGTIPLRGASLNIPSPVGACLAAIYGRKWYIPKQYTDWRSNYKNLYKGYWR